MTYEILNDLEIPQHARRSRGEGALKAAVRKLEVGQGFHFQSKSPLKMQYAKVAVRGEDGKKLHKTKVWMVKAAEVEGGENTFAVKRVA